MREDDALWTDEALRSDPRWEESRGLAAAAARGDLARQHGADQLRRRVGELAHARRLAGLGRLEHQLVEAADDRGGERGGERADARLLGAGGLENPRSCSA